MKKILFIVIMTIAFSTVSMANTVADKKVKQVQLLAATLVDDACQQRAILMLMRDILIPIATVWTM